MKWLLNVRIEFKYRNPVPSGIFPWEGCGGGTFVIKSGKINVERQGLSEGPRWKGFLMTLTNFNYLRG